MSFTHDEPIGIYDVMAKITWSRYFIEAKVYKIAQNKIIQDNKSSILLENNGKLSRSKRTKNIKTRHFFVTYKVA